MDSNFLITTTVDDSSSSVLFFLRTFLTFLGLLVQLRTTNQATGVISATSLSSSSSSSSSSSCPSQCLCEQVENRLSVDCSTSLNMTGVPQVPHRTMILKMDNANLGDIRERQYFIRKDLLELSTLSLRNCRMREVRPRIFWGLYNLKDLNLAKNEIRQIPLVKRGNVEVGPFVDMRNLQVLHLSFNNMTNFYTACLQGATNLIELDLSSNKLTFIVGVFDDFTNLKRIYLQNNKFKHLDSRPFEKLINLNMLNLINNQYICDCKLRKFVEWQRNKYLSNPPQCRQPNRLQGKSWDQIKAQEFACAPEMEPRKMAPLTVAKGRSLSLICTVHGDPQPVVSWNFRNGSGYSTQIPMENTKQYSFHVYTMKPTPTQSNVTVYNLTIYSMDQTLVGVYHCIGSNPADKDYVLFQVDLEQPLQHMQTVGINRVIQDETSSSTTMVNKSGASIKDATGGNIVLIGIVLGATVSVLTALLIMVLCYRHMNSLTRESHMSPVRQIQNGYGYHVIDNDISKTSTTTITEKSPEKMTSASSSSKPSSSVENDYSLKSNVAKEMKNSFAATSSTRVHNKLECHNYSPAASATSNVRNSTKMKRDNQPKRVIRFAVDENPDRVPRFKPTYHDRYEDDDVYGLDVRETAI